MNPPLAFKPDSGSKCQGTRDYTVLKASDGFNRTACPTSSHLAKLYDVSPPVKQILDFRMRAAKVPTVAASVGKSPVLQRRLGALDDQHLGRLLAKERL